MTSPPGKGPRRKAGGGRSPARRTPPPDATGLEAKYLEIMASSGASLIVVTSDGKKIRGVVREFDAELLTLDGEGGPVVLRKSSIRYLYEDSN